MGLDIFLSLALSGLHVVGPLTQGFALGWYLPPFQGGFFPGGVSDVVDAI